MTSLPAIDRSLLPADVRAAGPQAQQRYASALSFEQLLVGQLTEQLTASVGGDDDAQDGGDAVTNTYRQLLPDAMAQAITQAGGRGRARQLYDGMTEGDA